MTECNRFPLLTSLTYLSAFPLWKYMQKIIINNNYRKTIQWTTFPIIYAVPKYQSNSKFHSFNATNQRWIQFNFTISSFFCISACCLHTTCIHIFFILVYSSFVYFPITLLANYRSVQKLKRQASTHKHTPINAFIHKAEEQNIRRSHLVNWNFFNRTNNCVMP